MNTNTKNTNMIYWVSSLLWGIFLIGILEIISFFAQTNDYSNYFILSFLLCAVIYITALKTFQPKVGYYHELLPYLIHPLFLFVGIISFLFFNENYYLHQIAMFMTLFAYLVLFSENFSDLTHKAHDGVKFLIIFFLYNTTFEAVHYFNLNTLNIPLLVILISLLFFIHMLWRLQALKDIYLLLALLFSLVIGGVAFTISYYYLYASFLILSTILLVTYYVPWGIMHHYIQKNLTWNILVEYILVAGIILSMLVGLLTG